MPKKENGMAGVVDGKIVVVNPRGGGCPAVLYPPESGVEIFVNGVKVQNVVELREEDQIEVKPLVLIKKAKLQVKVSPDGLSALLAVSTQVTDSFSLKETGMTMSLQPGICKKVVPENVCTLADAEAELKKNKVAFGLDYTALKTTVDNAEGQFQIVARGQEIRKGKNGFIEFLVNPEKETISYGENKEKVDFRERYRFPMVQKGDRLALLHPPVEGSPGRSVTGDVKPPPVVKSAEIKCGEGVVLQGNGSEVIALKDGLLTVKGNYIKVESLLVHDKDVDLESGNLRFNGNIQIYGNIREGMRVETQGDLYVDGNGYQATVKAAEGVHFTGNLIQCKVEGGLYFTFLQGVSLLLEEVCTDYANFLKSVRQVLGILGQRKQVIDERAISFTIDSILKKTQPVMQENILKLDELLKRTVVQNQQIMLLKETLNALKNLLVLPGKPKPNDPQGLERLGKMMNSLLTEFQGALENTPLLSASYVQNSNLTHSGEIHIVGRGCYQSALRAGKGIQVQGMFRGGTLRARGDVKVGEFAQMVDATGVPGKEKLIGIVVPAEANIYFGKVHSDTSIQIGKLVYRFDRVYEKIKVNYNCKKDMFQINNY